MVDQIKQTRGAGLPQAVVFDQSADGLEIQTKTFEQTNEGGFHDSGDMAEFALQANADNTT